MKTDNKYYTPEIEEFHVGFEFEYQDIDTAAWTTDIFKIDWESADMDIHNWVMYFDVRVKYLDREDIESLGFEFKYNEKGNENIAFTKKYENHPRYDNQYVDVIWNYVSSHVLICEGDNETGWNLWVTRFSGTIKNKSELKKLLKQLGI